MSFQRLLVPHDGSPLADKAIASLLSFVAKGAEVTLVHVSRKGEAPPATIAEAAARLESAGARVEIDARTGEDAADHILDVVEARAPELVVISTHGRGGALRWVRGSVAERVLRACPVPLLMVNAFSAATVRFERVLLPSDGSANASAVLAPLAGMVEGRACDVTLLHVDTPYASDTPAAAKRRRAGRAGELRELLAPTAKQLEDLGLRAEIRIESGEPAEVILAVSTAGDHGLLALSTHGRSGTARWVLGSVAEKVLRECRLPVLVARRTDGSSP